MTLQTLFTIVLKIMGIYLIVSSISVLPEFFITLYSYSSFSNDNPLLDLLFLLVFLFILGFYYVVIKYLLFRTDWVIRKLSLLSSFTQDRIELNMHRSTVLTIAAISIGGLVCVDSFPLLCKQVYSYFQQQHLTDRFGDNPATQWLLIYFAKCMLGYFLMANPRYVVNLIERKRKRSNRIEPA